MCDSKENWYAQRKQDRQIFIHSASHGKLLTSESPTQQLKQHSIDVRKHVSQFSQIPQTSLVLQ
jgi:phage anti-repressor protein